MKTVRNYAQAIKVCQNEEDIVKQLILLRDQSRKEGEVGGHKNAIRLMTKKSKQSIEKRAQYQEVVGILKEELVWHNSN